MTLQFFNTLTRTKEPFVPLTQGKVGMYHCGPTVYHNAHIGNLRHYVLADLLRRIFESQQLKITQVINITDVGHLVDDGDEGEDKIEKASRTESKSPQEIADFYTTAFKNDLALLDVHTKETLFPKASDHIQEQIALIKILEKKGFIYTTSDGVYFDTSRLPDYGKLAGLDMKGLQEGARVAINPEKKNPTDFAVWKFSNEKRLQEWESPWGVGFPGWHIECSAMAMKYLGETIDIHTSGVDHIPTHHSNEIAQSESATGKQFVRFWLHNEHVLVDGKKMSKSLGNVFLLSDLIEKGYSPLSYRYFLLSAHYRTLVNFTWEALEGASRALGKLQEQFLELKDERKVTKRTEAFLQGFTEKLFDDIDTPGALALVWNTLKDDSLTPLEKKELLFSYDTFLGLGLSTLRRDALPPYIEKLADERKKAREEGSWEHSDLLRREIEHEGFVVKDTPEGQEIQKKLR